jgi:four helix bundle protein
MVKSYKDLTVWQKSMDMVVDVYALTKSFPHSEVFGLASQMQRAAVSIPSNVAEGCERGTQGDFARFLSIASGSVAELETQILVATKLGYLTPESIGPVLSLCDEIGKMLRALRNAVLSESNHK